MGLAPPYSPRIAREEALNFIEIVPGHRIHKIPTYFY